MRTQVVGLVHPGFVTTAGIERLPHLKRYLRGMLRRIEVLPLEPARDAAAMSRVAIMQAEYEDVRARLSPERRNDEALQRVRWMIEEFRVSLFAQRLGTAHPVSEQRIRRALDEVG
jgi:ATP-dependent helicase HrpA